MRFSPVVVTYIYVLVKSLLSDVFIATVANLVKRIVYSRKIAIFCTVITYFVSFSQMFLCVYKVVW